MNIFPIKKDVIQKVQDGILKAKSNFSLWTGEELYLSYAPANFLAIHISQEIASLEDKPEIFINASISDTLQYSLKKRNDYKEFMKSREITDGTFCISLDERFDHETNKDAIARVIISVKNGVRNVKDEYINDIEVLSKVVSDSNIEYGMFAFYLDISNKARIDGKTRITELIKAFDEVTSNYEKVNSKFIGGEVNIIENVGEWSVGCYVIEKKE